MGYTSTIPSSIKLHRGSTITYSPSNDLIAYIDSNISVINVSDCTAVGTVIIIYSFALKPEASLSLKQLNTSSLFRVATQGPSRMSGGRQLSQSELQDKRKNEEKEGKRKLILAEFEKKQRRDKYKHDEKEREEKQNQEKKLKARISAQKQAMKETDRNFSHRMVTRETRLCHFDQSSL